ncbi:hypothetical protein TNCV_2510611 [Trichonephila clavipes]|nr:hypothetical protein TNCV_2510611 [Trichonephila clavipes]
MTHVLPLVGPVRFARKFKNLYRWRGYRGERKDGEKEEERKPDEKSQQDGHREDDRLREIARTKNEVRLKMAKEWMDGDFANLDESNAN